ncbi:MAG: glycosyltransferase, partial [Rickettsiales bacterium]|nr:glycosyltransferase [Rickettsiales bacterium]
MPPRAPRKPFKPSEQHAVLVLGMHRSGTSVLARLCNLLGAEIGTALLPARKDNEKGFWEHAEIVDLHEHVLPTLTTAWDDPRELPADWWQDSRLVPYKKKLKQLLKQEFADAPLWIVKDPRLSILMPMWQDILQELQVTPHVLIMLRSPAAVAKSLMKRDAFTAEKALMLWCRYMLDAERATRHMPRSFVAFDALLNDWEQTMQTVAIQTGVQWPKRPSSVAKKVTDFIEPALVHASQNAVLPAIKDATLAIWVQRIDAALNTDGTTDTQTLDQVYAEIQQMYKRDLACYGSWLDEAIVRRYQEIYAQNEIANTRQALKEARRDASQAHTLLKRSESERLVLTHELDTRNQEYSILNAEADQYQQRLARIEASVPWRVWRVLRAMGRRLARLKLFCYPIVYLRILDVLRQEGIGGVLARTKRLLLGSEVQALADYPSWIAQYDTLSDGARDYMMHAIKAMQNPPLISVVMPVYNVEEKWLREAIDSVLAQCYPHWELCIADDCSSKPHIRTILEEYVAKDDRVKVIFRETNGHISESSNSALTLATGSYVALMDHDDLLPEHALFMVAQALAEYPETDMLYTDEDKVDDKGHRYGAYFKSEWNPDLFLGQNMFSHLGVYRRSLLNKIGGFRKGVEGSQDYDLALRCLPYTKPERIRHLPHILYHWRAIPGSTALENMEKDYAQPSSERALSDYFAKQKLQATILPGKDRLVRHIKWALPKISPKVSLFLRTD